LRLYRAICAWLEANAHTPQANEPQREGNNFSHIELGGDMPTFPEMHIGYRPQSIDDDNGARKPQPISMRWNPK
jgi:hypothetical protein